MIPTSLQPLAAYRQFVLWRLVQREGQKPLKLPVSPHTGNTCDAHDVTQWVTHEQAESLVSVRGATGVAFVFAESDPFWFLDIDDCRLPDGSYTQLATTLCSMFPGAAMEISQSGKGLHLFGRGNAPPHGCKNVGLHIEFYTQDRFVALTGTSAMGDANTDHTAMLHSLVAQFFPIDGASGDAGDEAWADVASPEWDGPADDGELIRRMLNTKKGAQHILGGKASIQDLWTADVDALGRSYPDESRPYDASGADRALAQHLAFWTGRNTERMRRLMRLSALVRPKWDAHRKYLWMTIKGACNASRDVYIEKRTVSAVPAAAPVPVAELLPDDGVFRTGVQMLTLQQQPDYFKNCIYVMDRHVAFTPVGMLKPEQFKAWYGGFDFIFDNTNGKVTKDAWEALTQSRGVAFPKVESSCFRPASGSFNIIDEEGRRLINTYRPIVTRRVAGDASPFLNHIATILPSPRDQQIVISYMAAMVQNPGVKFQWCPVIQGAEGNGKTILLRIMEHCIGRTYTHLPNSKELAEGGGKFTAWIDCRLFIGFDEIKVGDKAEMLEVLKPIVSNDRIEIQGKGKDQVTGDNFANALMLTNYKDAIGASPDRRRYAIFFCAQQCYADIERDGMAGDYFPKLWDWCRADGYAIVNDYLAGLQIEDELNPAKLCHRAPATGSTQEALKIARMGGIEQEIQEAIDEGRRGFIGGWISSLQLDALLKSLHKGHLVPHTKRRQILQSLGYDHHPGLTDGRVNNAIPMENGKPRLFIKHGHISREMTDASSIVHAYLKAQGVGNLAMPSPEGIPNVQTLRH